VPKARVAALASAAVLFLTCCGGGGEERQPGLAISECGAAANELGRTVLCPTIWYSTKLRRLSCDEGCIGLVQTAGTPTRAFVLGAEDFDALGGDTLAATAPIRHAVVVGRSADEPPTEPCSDSSPAGSIARDVNERLGSIPIVSCSASPRTDSIDGGKVFMGHLLATVRFADTYTQVSVHGFGVESRRELTQVIRGLEPVAPTRPTSS
jgi:hypothetical protein